MSENVISLGKRPMAAARKAELWEGIVRLMEVNGRCTFEIGIDDVREIAALMRGAANG